VQPPRFGALPVECLDERLVGQALLDGAGDRAADRALARGGTFQLAREPLRGHQEQRRDGEGHQSQVPPDVDCRADEHRGADRGGDHADQTGGHQPLDHLDVVDEADHQVTEAPLVEEIGREALGVGE
jgi:hypothetical protein